MTTDAYHKTTATQSYASFARACEDERWADALAFGTATTAYIDLGYGGTLPVGAGTHLAVTLDALSSGDGVNVKALR